MRVSKRRVLSIWFILMLPLTATIVVSAWFAYSELFRLKLEPIETRHNELIDQISNRFSRELGYFGQLTMLLKRSGPLQSGLDQTAPPDIDALERLLVRFSRASSLISQLRWLDSAGQERIRVNVRNGVAITAPEHTLQNKKDRYYFQSGSSVSSDEVYYSPLDLNIENGVLEMPPNPTLRTSVRTGVNDGLHNGLLVLNFSLRKLFDEVRQLHSADTQTEIVNADGYWLLHPELWREWGFIYHQPKLVIQNEFPSLWQHMTKSSSARGLRIDERLWSYAHITAHTQEKTLSPSGWYLVLTTPPDLLASLRRSVLLPTLSGSLLVMLLLGGVLYRIAQGEAQRMALLEQLKAEQKELQHTNEELWQSLSRQQKLQDELVETRKLSSLGMMVAGVAHELNTPTGGALVTLSTLSTAHRQLKNSVQAGTLTREQMQNFLEHTDEGLSLAQKNLGKSIELIKSFKRLAIDRNQDQPSHFDLQSCVQDLILTLNPRLKHSPVSLESDIPPCEMFSHPGIVSQVLQNLISNALSHAFKPGQRGKIVLRGVLREDGHTIQLSVQDNGCGIAPEIHPKLFDPFVTAGRGKGHTGLGLHLVQQWVTQTLMGSIRVSSTQNGGTCFTIDIPVSVTDHPATL